MPFDVQIKALRTIPGLENSQIIRPAYAVEYDYAFPTQLSLSLESNVISCVFFAGQINGTSGYEEAAAQGLIAGTNASHKAQGKSAVIIGREIGYIGVLIDDLTSKGVTEPYRMFTSRAEFRLLFNHGSSELRYYSVHDQTSLISTKRKYKIKDKIESIRKWTYFLNRTKIESNKTFGDLLRSDQKFDFPAEFSSLSNEIKEEVMYQVKYAGYLKRELQNLEKFKHSEKIIIPQDFSYDGIPGLRKESIEKLNSVSPNTLGHASRIPGVNPSDVEILMIMIQGKSIRK